MEPGSGAGSPGPAAARGADNTAMRSVGEGGGGRGGREDGKLIIRREREREGREGKAESE